MLQTKSPNDAQKTKIKSDVKSVVKSVLLTFTFDITFDINFYSSHCSHSAFLQKHVLPLQWEQLFSFLQHLCSETLKK